MDICDQNTTIAESFNLVIDKGTLDSLVCCEPEMKKVELMLQNVYKMLSPGGSFICVSRGAPETRLFYLQEKSLRWTVETIKVHKLHQS